ncbi:hypothetical protein PG995_012400 [Apiospora arundinis]|uniref:Uncharacterized protein n=1 Tax=Apiospora arundinis TaxID=335852 RepID=A0ABR2HJH9_9PEZI
MAGQPDNAAPGGLPFQIGAWYRVVGLASGRVYLPNAQMRTGRQRQLSVYDAVSHVSIQVSHQVSHQASHTGFSLNTNTALGRLRSWMSSLHMSLYGTVVAPEPIIVGGGLWDENGLRKGQEM